MFSIILALMCGASLCKAHGSGFTSGDWEFGFDGPEKAVINRYNGANNVVNIPPYINGGLASCKECGETKAEVVACSSFVHEAMREILQVARPVTQVGSGGAIFGEPNSVVTSVTIPDSVTVIGSSAFRRCLALSKVNIPSSVTEIGIQAFEGCTNLTSLTIPEGVAEIGEYAFSDCWSLGSVTIPDSVISIGENAFWGCDALTNVIIPVRFARSAKRVGLSSPRISFRFTDNEPQDTTTSGGAKSVVGVYKYNHPPGFIASGADVITLSGDGSFKLELALSRGKAATFLGTWVASGRDVSVVTTERLLDGIPNPPSDPTGWKPGQEMTLRIDGDKLYKRKDSQEAFIRVKE